ncbi:hypothetical protein [Corynebacterium sp. TAE3-ERU2]|uniref:hypothetical protein n=1 Tax=Corynebacterium sp. TAE3-ERU2 TaxID=2849497 RepID=UPI00351CC2D8
MSSITSRSEELRAKRRGAQKPTFLVKPVKESVDTFDGEDYVDLAAAFGLIADEWQEGIVTGVCARGVDGRLTAKRVGISIPRQNGKNGALEIIELGQMVLEGRKVLHSAHEVKTGRKAFRRLAAFFEDRPELSRMVKEIRRVNGQESIELSNGGSCEFIARSKSSGRGYSVDTLVLDEAQQLSDEALEALMPTIASGPAGMPQIIMLGTPPEPTDISGEVFRRTHDEAHTKPASDLWWCEFSVLVDPEGPEIDADDVDLWYQANPALGGRLEIETVMSERAVMADASFRRERLGMWEQERTARVLPLEDWKACADPNLADSGEPVVFAVDISPQRDQASIAAAGLTTDGLPWVDVVEHRRGAVDWVVPRLKAILETQEARAVMIDVLSPAGSLIDPLEVEGITVSRIGSNILAMGCGQFYDAVMAHAMRHLDQTNLSLAVAAARKRKLGDSWAWSRANIDADITPLVAATMAMSGLRAQKVKRPMKRKRERRKVVVW